ncbi:MAG: class I SAM-dependent methyltransferase [Anaerolineae bacterium]|nr:class I SAM-dependent methyltransferase [Anaerolineae bacterium]
MTLFSDASLAQQETIQCDLCAHDDYVVLYPSTVCRDLISSEFTVFGEFEHTQIVRCKHCQLVYANPRDHPQFLHHNYQRMPIDEYLSEESSREWAFTATLQRIQRYVPYGRVLDVGCSAGLFLKSLPERYERYGLELGHESAAIARSRGIGTILEQPLEEADFNPETFDLVTMWDVLEHLPSPRRALQRVWKWLRPGGHLLIVTPDIGSLTARLLGPRWPHLIRQHLYYFSFHTLHQLLNQLDYQPVWRGYWIRYFTFGYLLRRSHLLPSEAALPSQVERLLSLRIPVTLRDDMFVIATKLPHVNK